MEWWSRTGSNRRHPACKAGALPAELRPHLSWPQAPAATSVALACAPSGAIPGSSPRTGSRSGLRMRSASEAPDPQNMMPSKMVGLGGLEPPTSRLSSARSNQLSYKPKTAHPAVRTDETDGLARPSGRRGSCRALAERQQPTGCDTARERRSKSFTKKEKRRRQRPLGMHGDRIDFRRLVPSVSEGRGSPFHPRTRE